MKKLIAFLLIFIPILGSCSKEYSVFSGESQHWAGRYSVNIDGNEEHGNYDFHYKNGDKDTKFENLEISISSKFEQTSKKVEIHKGATIFLSSNCQGCMATDKKESIKVTIKWNGNNEETFLLKSKK